MAYLKIGSSNLSLSSFPAGQIVQVVRNTFNTTTVSDSFGATMAKVTQSSVANHKNTINNVVSGNDVFIMCSFQLRAEGSGVNAGGEVVLTRDTTNLWSGTHYDQYAWGDSSMGFDRITHLNWLDESPATGTNVYYLSGRRYDSNTNMTIKGNGFPFKMILMEIQR